MIVSQGAPQLPHHVREPLNSTTNDGLYLQALDLQERQLHHVTSNVRNYTLISLLTRGATNLVGILGDELTKFVPELVLGFAGTGHIAVLQKKDASLPVSLNSYLDLCLSVCLSVCLSLSLSLSQSLGALFLSCTLLTISLSFTAASSSLPIDFK